MLSYTNTKKRLTDDYKFKCKLAYEKSFTKPMVEEKLLHIPNLSEFEIVDNKLSFEDQQMDIGELFTLINPELTDPNIINKQLYIYLIIKIYQNKDNFKYRGCLGKILDQTYNVIKLDEIATKNENFQLVALKKMIENKDDFDLTLLDETFNIYNATLGMEFVQKYVQKVLYSFLQKKFMFKYIKRAVLYNLSINPDPVKNEELIQYEDFINLSINFLQSVICKKLFQTYQNKDKDNFQVYYAKFKQNCEAKTELFFKQRKSLEHSYINQKDIKRYDAMNLEQLRELKQILLEKTHDLVKNDSVIFSDVYIFPEKKYNEFSLYVDIMQYIRKRENIVKKQLAEKEESI